MADVDMKLDRNSSMESLNAAREEIELKLHTIEHEYYRAAKMDPQYVELAKELKRLETCVKLKITLDYG